jgi:hypothetical protein
LLNNLSPIEKKLLMFLYLPLMLLAPLALYRSVRKVTSPVIHSAQQLPDSHLTLQHVGPIRNVEAQFHPRSERLRIAGGKWIDGVFTIQCPRGTGCYYILDANQDMVPLPILGDEGSPGILTIGKLVWMFDDDKWLLLSSEYNFGS